MVLIKSVNVHVYSPESDIPMSSAGCTIYTSDIRTYSLTVSSLGEN